MNQVYDITRSCLKTKEENLIDIKEDKVIVCHILQALPLNLIEYLGLLFTNLSIFI